VEKSEWMQCVEPNSSRHHFPLPFVVNYNKRYPLLQTFFTEKSVDTMDRTDTLFFAYCARKKKFSFGLRNFFATLTPQKGGGVRKTGAILVKDGGLGNMRPMKGEQACALQN